MKKAICLLFAVLMVVSLAGCAPKNNYTCIDLSMRVPEGMTNVTDNEDVQGYGFSFALENSKMFICGLRQDFLDLENGASMTLEDYVHKLIETYGLATATHGERHSKGYIYLRFTLPLESGMNEYLCGAYRFNGAFWLIQMNGLTENFNEAQWFEYLDSVVEVEVM